MADIDNLYTKFSN